jgi:hypothetical protein
LTFERALIAELGIVHDDCRRREAAGQNAEPDRQSPDGMRPTATAAAEVRTANVVSATVKATAVLRRSSSGPPHPHRGGIAQRNDES